MTSPESITVSLDMAKKLAAAGWPQDSAVHVWYPPKRSYSDWEIDRGGSWNIDGEQPLDAPTAEEILRRLPDNLVEVNDKWYMLNIAHRYCSLYIEEDEDLLVDFSDDTLADALASMWCYLKANNLLPAA